MGWKGQGVELPHGTIVRITYRRERRYGSIVGASFAFGRDRFTSPSSMAQAMARDIVGEKGRFARGLGGWCYLWVLRPSDKKWRALSSLR